MKLPLMTPLAAAGALLAALLLVRSPALAGTAAESAVRSPTALAPIPLEFELDDGPAKDIVEAGAGTGIRVFLVCQGTGGNFELTAGSQTRILGVPELTATYIDVGAGTMLKGSMQG